MSDRVEIRHRETGELLFAQTLAEGSPARALGVALAAAVAGGVDLAGAELRDADAHGADLKGAMLAGACLTGAVLDGCDLSGAILTDALMLRVSAIGASFERADLSDAHAWASVMTGASFKDAHAASANFDDAVMQGANLHGADFTDTCFWRTNLAGADLRSTVLDGADLRGATLDDAMLDGASLIGTLMGDRAPDDVPESEDVESRHLETADEPPAAIGTDGVFCWKRRWLVRAGPGAALAAGMSGWMSFQLAFGSLGEGSSTFGRITLAATFAAFALALGGAAITYIAALFQSAPVVTIDAAGIRDTRLTDAPIAWTDIAGAMPLLHGGQMMLMLNVTTPRRYGLSRNPLWAVNRLCSRLLRRPELAVRMTGLEGDLDRLVKAIQAAAPPA